MAPILAKFKWFVKKNRKDIYLFVIVFFASFLSFLLGFLINS